MDQTVAFSRRVVRVLWLAMSASAVAVVLSVLHQFEWHVGVSGRAAGVAGLLGVALMCLAYRWTMPPPKANASIFIGGMLAMSVVCLFDTRTLSSDGLLSMNALGCSREDLQRRRRQDTGGHVEARRLHKNPGCVNLGLPGVSWCLIGRVTRLVVFDGGKLAPHFAEWEVPVRSVASCM